MREINFNHVSDCLTFWVQSIVQRNRFPIAESNRSYFVELNLEFLELKVYEALENIYDGPIIPIGNESDFYYPIKDLVSKLSLQSKKVDSFWISKEVKEIAKIITHHAKTIMDQTQ